MDEWLKKLGIAALDVWNAIFWPEYKPNRHAPASTASLVPGELVTPARDVASLQTVDGLMVACDRLGTGIVQELDADGAVLVRWSDTNVETWVERAELRAIDPGWCLVTIVRCDERGHRTLLRRTIALLQHHWTIQLLPDNVVRAERSDGLSWTFIINPVNHGVTATWGYPPEDDDAEALTAAELVAA